MNVIPGGRAWWLRSRSVRIKQAQMMCCRLCAQVLEPLSCTATLRRESCFFGMTIPLTICGCPGNLLADVFACMMCDAWQGHKRVSKSPENA
jgi:hypothetical protein